MIVDDEARRMDVLTTNLATGEEALPVFSFEDEARMFLELGALGADWRVRVTSPGELISVLFASARTSSGSHWTRCPIQTVPP